ncbi:hypothetical protein ACYSNR_17550 [Enterococcus sp. LJL128]|uniref:hypothetical protein n=1 Tax=Enterococcus sp. LJL51 TaxID=3416656 RepID=UPI003CFB8AF5
MIDFMLSISFSITIGLIVGFIWGIYSKILRPNQRELNRASFLTQKMKDYSTIINLFTFLLLGIGLVWTFYFMFIGIIDPSQTEYATNVSQLIVSVLTVFSIIIAFYQFLKGQ